MELLCGPDGELPEKLRNLETRLIKLDHGQRDRDPNVRWDDVGCKTAPHKEAVYSTPHFRKNVLEKDGLFNLSNETTDAIRRLTKGYSGPDMKKEDMRLINLQGFEKALEEVRPSVSLNELGTYEKWNMQFGSLSL
ncbi:ATPase family AAA domain-containing protein FIGL1-like [Salvia splendens]|uniref:ATPase family AAA domain-containing protein FIGL1-like n=1 Tax=Salvia splendens TaxID=180675 RepID=UPI001C27F41D|nr:ATPase family AAA domain-containing protein FIGL1-like [Salvia splendens]